MGSNGQLPLLAMESTSGFRAPKEQEFHTAVLCIVLADLGGNPA